jgi:glycosyltransferase involved in cell wall biosynthesis
MVRVVLIGNYKPDAQESMARFTLMLKSGLEQNNVTAEVWYPTIFFGKFSKSTLRGIGKWLGYIDKWLIFPVIMRWNRIGEKDTYFHICDHSNAPYVPHLPKGRTSITCHDVLAIRGALGFKDAYCPATRTGKIFQNWILSNLLKADKIASVSHFTHDQLVALNKGVAKPGWQVIHNGFNAGFEVLADSEWKQVLTQNGQDKLLEKPYILHVGSNLQRKNRKMLLNMVAALGDRWNGNVCFTGQPMNDELKSLAAQLHLTDRIIEVVKPPHKYLEALINGAQVFVFPSFSEGFGWPVSEAQACGTPVIASSLQPMPEVGGDGAWYADPYNADEFADVLLKILSGTEQQVTDVVDKGFKNVLRFDTALMIQRYLKLILP